MPGLRRPPEPTRPAPADDLTRWEVRAMALPKIPVTGAVFLPDDTTPCTGSAIFTPGDGLLVDAADGRILAGELTVDLASGIITTGLVPTDTPGTQPEPDTWNWTVRFKLNEASVPPFSFAVPSDADSIDLATVARLAPAPGTYTVVPGPAGPPGPKGDKGDPGSTGGVSSVNDETGAVILTAAKVGADPAGAAATAQTAATTTAAADATTKVTAHTNAADPHGDRAAAATDAAAKVTAHSTASDPHGDRAAAATALTGHAAAADPHGDRAWATGQFDTLGSANAAQAAAESYTDTAVAGEADRADAYADTGDAATLASAKAYTDSHSGGGPGGVLPIPYTSQIDAGIVVLSGNGAWTPVVGSNGVHVRRIIPNVTPGDLMQFDASFLSIGTVYFLDARIPLGDGTGYSRYLSSVEGDSIPGPEGYAPWYTQLSFKGFTSSRWLTAKAQEIDPAGNWTIEMVFQGSNISDTSNHLYFGNGYFGTFDVIHWPIGT